MENLEQSAQTAQKPKTQPNPWMIATLVLAGIIIGFAASQFIPFLQDKDGSDKTETASETGAAQQAYKEPQLTKEQIAALPDDDPFEGEADAPVTLVEFSDFECPYCSKFFRETLPQIKENYIKTGKVRLVYRDFPIEKHAGAIPAALSAECANNQEKFWEMHNMIFEKQIEWTGNPDTSKIFEGYAKNLGLDMTAYGECIKSPETLAEVRKDLLDGATMGINGTPGFFLNGRIISGAMPYEQVFKKILDAELEGKKWNFVYDLYGNVRDLKVES